MSVGGGPGEGLSSGSYEAGGLLSAADHMAKAEDYLGRAELAALTGFTSSAQAEAYAAVARGHLDAARTIAELFKAGLATGNGQVG